MANKKKKEKKKVADVRSVRCSLAGRVQPWWKMARDRSLSPERWVCKRHRRRIKFPASEGCPQDSRGNGNSFENACVDNQRVQWLTTHACRSGSIMKNARPWRFESWPTIRCSRPRWLFRKWKSGFSGEQQWRFPDFPNKNDERISRFVHKVHAFVLSFRNSV